MTPEQEAIERVIRESQTQQHSEVIIVTVDRGLPLVPMAIGFLLGVLWTGAAWWLS